MPERRRTRAQERADEIDISPTALLAQIETLTDERDDATQERRRIPGRPPARARRVPELQAPDDRGARCATSGSPARTSSARCWPSPTTSTAPSRRDRQSIADDPWFEGIAAIDRKLRLLLESEGVTADRRLARHAVRPARARGDRQRARHRPAGRRDRRGGPARLSTPRPRHPAGPRGRRRRHHRRQPTDDSTPLPDPTHIN